MMGGVNDLIRSGSTWMASQYEADSDTDATYCRDSNRLPIQASKLGGSRDVVDTETGGIDVSAQRFSVRRSELVFHGKILEPQKGDCIEVLEHGRLRVYEARIPDSAQQCFESADGGLTDTHWIIHTKRIK